MFFTHEWRCFVQLHQTREIFVMCCSFLLYQSLSFMVYFLLHSFFLLRRCPLFPFSPSPTYQSYQSYQSTTYTRKKGNRWRKSSSSALSEESKSSWHESDMNGCLWCTFDVCEKRGKVSPPSLLQIASFIYVRHIPFALSFKMSSIRKGSLPFSVVANNASIVVLSMSMSCWERKKEWILPSSIFLLSLAHTIDQKWICTCTHTFLTVLKLEQRKE